MIFALSGDRHFLQNLKEGKMTGYVHSIFKRTINMVCLENEQLFTIACKEIDNAPNTLLLDCLTMENLPIAVNDHVWSDGYVLWIGTSQGISLSGTQSWEMKLPDYPNNTDLLRKNLKYVKQRIGEVGKAGGIKPLVKYATPFEEQVSVMLSRKTESLVAYLAAGDLAESLKCAQSLLGLGPGLTPSGDDYLTGMIAVFMVNKHPIPELRTFGESIEVFARTATHIISYSAIEQASIGRVRQSIAQLITFIFTGDEELLPAVDEVLKIGSSSGTDIAIGIVAAIELTMKIGGNL
ncbi:DUF2877 domain-containing protein [Sporosarcina sp. BI001-red]|uniref:DUF2877 domain-containing protein n=1 Tax=Sporosarcina sp. BI001-red TaxID=2282866 RepID=UPI000E23B391|nr:DUF2877 domain-containing protein [Sporosarcina sp. BI001-red]REB05277.1 DUF2877 domain-containing protein [Sporosarcina sp. BI001-red]